MKLKHIILGAVLLLLFSGISNAQEESEKLVSHKFKLELEAEYRYFHEAVYSGVIAAEGKLLFCPGYKALS